MENRILKDALSIIADCKRQTNDIWDAHFGAAAIASYFSFENTIPGRSWIGYRVSEVKRITIDENDPFPSIGNTEQLSAFILNELASFQTIFRAEAHHDLIGHALTYSHALNILYDLGHITYWDFGHVFKFPFSFYNHLNRLSVQMPKAEDNFRYLV
ncbi:hypothetical protein D3P07_08585 [Paenibacillus sp. 1011MAR3C5]|uniref:hypothetical protein n=1 Tax=Paenibacillus sp. 1011MAR3C5 TaxID=1675787 RepID=UPI000E6C16A8|nr:hypothetical protein [Paenibacillus sp. 1011MAR3C5]RJE90253.1 hypothetical protein D3P07_08585 [Paenibacillus sp. 1011MAR3C5]